MTTHWGRLARPVIRAMCSLALVLAGCNGGGGGTTPCSGGLVSLSYDAVSTNCTARTTAAQLTQVGGLMVTTPQAFQIDATECGQDAADRARTIHVTLAGPLQAGMSYSINPNSSSTESHMTYAESGGDLTATPYWSAQSGNVTVMSVQANTVMLSVDNVLFLPAFGTENTAAGSFILTGSMRIDQARDP